MWIPQTGRERKYSKILNKVGHFNARKIILRDVVIFPILQMSQKTFARHKVDILFISRVKLYFESSAKNAAKFYHKIIGSRPL